jgi:hypothetical protein
MAGNIFQKWIAKQVTKGAHLPSDLYFPINALDNPSTLLTGLLVQNRVNIDCTTKSGQQDAYDNCPIVGTVVERRGDYIQSGILKVVNSEGKDVTTSEAKAALKLLDQPNPMMDREEFERTVDQYYSVFGFCPILPIYPSNRPYESGKPNGIPVALWPIHPRNFTYSLTGKLFKQTEISGIVSSITFSHATGETITLTGQDINSLWIFNGKTARKDDYYTAQSPLFSATDAVSLFNSGLNAYGQLVKQSILGIISTRDRSASAAIPMKSGEKTEVQQKLSDRYGLVEGRDKFLVTNKDLMFQSLLTNIGNLGLPDAFKMAMDTICDRMGLQTELLSLKDATYENKKTAEIAQYNSQTIPYCNKFGRMLTNILGLQNCQVVYDFSHISVLQENEKEKADIMQVYVNSVNTLVGSQIWTPEEAKSYLDENGILTLDTQ